VDHQGDLWGDQLRDALAAVGVTKEEIERWLGAPCGCDERRQKLNALHLWLKQTTHKGFSRAKEFLKRIIS
jgi:hypothetical protein